MRAEPGIRRGRPLPLQRCRAPDAPCHRARACSSRRARPASRRRGRRLLPRCRSRATRLESRICRRRRSAPRRHRRRREGGRRRPGRVGERRRQLCTPRFNALAHWTATGLMGSATDVPSRQTSICRLSAGQSPRQCRPTNIVGRRLARTTSSATLPRTAQLKRPRPCDVMHTRRSASSPSSCSIAGCVRVHIGRGDVGGYARGLPGEALEVCPLPVFVAVVPVRGREQHASVHSSCYLPGNRKGALRERRLVEGNHDRSRHGDVRTREGGRCRRHVQSPFTSAIGPAAAHFEGRSSSTSARTSSHLGATFRFVSRRDCHAHTTTLGGSVGPAPGDKSPFRARPTLGVPPRPEPGRPVGRLRRTVASPRPGSRQPEVGTFDPPGGDTRHCSPLAISHLLNATDQKDSMRPDPRRRQLEQTRRSWRLPIGVLPVRHHPCGHRENLCSGMTKGDRND